MPKFAPPPYTLGSSDFFSSMRTFTHTDTAYAVVMQHPKALSTLATIVASVDRALGDAPAIKDTVHCLLSKCILAFQMLWDR